VLDRSARTIRVRRDASFTATRDVLHLIVAAPRSPLSPAPPLDASRSCRWYFSCLNSPSHRVITSPLRVTHRVQPLAKPQPFYFLLWSRHTKDLFFFICSFNPRTVHLRPPHPHPKKTLYAIDLSAVSQPFSQGHSSLSCLYAHAYPPPTPHHLWIPLTDGEKLHTRNTRTQRPTTTSRGIRIDTHAFAPYRFFLGSRPYIIINSVVITNQLSIANVAP
jgi:hypothetical protein